MDSSEKRKIDDILDIEKDSNFCCPITHNIFTEPVLLSHDGYTYEKASIEKWLSLKNKSPMTGEVVNVDQTFLIPNYRLKSLAETYRTNLLTKCVKMSENILAKRDEYDKAVSTKNHLKCLYDNQVKKLLARALKLNNNDHSMKMKILDLIDRANILKDMKNLMIETQERNRVLENLIKEKEMMIGRLGKGRMTLGSLGSSPQQNSRRKNVF